MIEEIRDRNYHTSQVEEDTANHKIAENRNLRGKKFVYHSFFFVFIFLPFLRSIFFYVVNFSKNNRPKSHNNFFFRSYVEYLNCPKYGKLARIPDEVVKTAFELRDFQKSRHS